MQRLNKTCVLILFVLDLFALSIAHAATDPFVGQYIATEDGEQYHLSINRVSDGSYHGQLGSNGGVIPFSAHKAGNKIVGALDEDGEHYNFSIIQQKGGALSFTDEDGALTFYPASREEENTMQSETSNISEKAATVFINRSRLNPATLQELEIITKSSIGSGRYWYDQLSGAWGIEGGPTAGFIVAGLNLPGPLPSDISGGGTDIFINGREIHPLDQRGLQQLFGITYSGRYWLDSQGNLGVEGGPAITNIVVAIQAARQQQGGGSVTHGYGSAGGARGTLAGGMYSGRTASGKSVFWYQGM